ncbi:Protease IV [Sulfurovum sp. enrichment culture clone C5]|uniref:Protease IV n=1 Tax=Sulfurovum sp. enrichment culture clone C5 TaxID=497650 RepID=A0A0S4XPC3_9BACT|nr:Protease IV [Sulfurovum sp. enrichment culture clone C5]
MFKTISDVLKWIGSHFLGLLFVLIVLIIILPSEKPKNFNANLQEIELKGPIMSSDDILKQIEDAKDNEKIKGVLFSINSPGGAVAPSIDIAYAIKDLSKTKPVLVYGGDVMASGGYYSAIYANKIMANPGSMIGSIGVIMEGANIDPLLKKIGIETQIVKQGRYKEIGTMSREWTEEERKELETITRDTYDLFVKDVTSARKLNIKNMDQYADAHVYSALRAKNVGLIDLIGTKQQAKEEIKKMSNVKEAKWKEKDKVDQFFDKLSSETASKISSYIFGLKATMF